MAIPPAIIQVTERLAYLNALEAAQLGGPKDSFEQLIAAAIYEPGLTSCDHC